jgi:hypothetical protein
MVSQSKWSLKILAFCLGLAFLAPGNMSQEKSTPRENLSVHTLQDGGQLLSFCENKADARTDFCLGYITGTANHFTLTNALLKFAKRGGEGGTCLPERAPPRQLIDVFVKYARNHPEERQIPAQYMIGSAWHEAFPCE